jgi:hypothetical protein
MLVDFAILEKSGCFLNFVRESYDFLEFTLNGNTMEAGEYVTSLSVVQPIDVLKDLAS